MKQKIKIFFSKHRLILIIAFLLIGTLFTHPITVYSSDSDYIKYPPPMLAIHSSSGGANFRFPCENGKDGLELVMFTEKGYVGPGGHVTQLTEGRFTREEIENCNMQITMWYQYPDSIMYGQDYELGELTYTDYIGFIIKKNGCVVSASLYKVYGFTPYASGLIEEVCHIKYPVLNCFVTETHAKSELRKIALIDRILTMDSEIDRQNALDWEECSPTP